MKRKKTIYLFISASSSVLVFFLLVFSGSGNKSNQTGSPAGIKTASFDSALAENTVKTRLFAMGDRKGIDKESSKPRFSSNNDGTVTDNVTGLIWLKNANCFGKMSWTKATEEVGKLSDGSCGLSDGSKPGVWRLPGKEELMSIIHNGYNNPALSNDAGTSKWKEGKGSSFTNVQSYYYWTNSAGQGNTGNACYISLRYANEVRYGFKTFLHYVWPVRNPVENK